MDERPALTTADMLAALGWHTRQWAGTVRACDAHGREEIGFEPMSRTWYLPAKPYVRIGTFDAAVKSAYDARLPADADRVETSPLDIARAENARLKAELSAVHSALRNGSDELVWPPGFTVAEAVARLVRLYDAVTSALQERA